MQSRSTVPLSLRLVIATSAFAALMAIVAFFIAGMSAALWVAVAGVLTLVLAYGLVLRRLAPEMKTRAAQLAQQQSLLVAQLREAAAQEERNRLARDLHDTIKQQLFSINVAAATAQSLRARDPQAADEHIQEVRQLAQAAMVEMKALLTQLRPQPLAAVGLAQAIRDQLDALHFRSEVVVDFQCDSLPDESRLPLGAQEAIFRIAQEALANISRHARATHVAVAITHDHTALTVCIRDDGQGFDPSNTREGMGMSNMRARVAELGGQFRVESSPSAGSEVVFTIPLVRERLVVDAALVEKRYKLNQVATTAWAVAGVAAVFAVFAANSALTNSTQPASLIWVALLGMGLVAAVVVAGWTYGKIRSVLPAGSRMRDVVLGGVLGAGVSATLIGTWAAFNMSSYVMAAVCSLSAVALVAASAVLNERLFAHTLHEWTTIEKEQATLRSWQWLGPLFLIMQVFWLTTQAPFDMSQMQFTQPFEAIVKDYVQANAFWWLWLITVLGFVLFSRRRIGQLEQMGVHMVRVPSRAPADVTARTSLSRWRIAAVVLTVVYLLVALPLTGMMLFGLDRPAWLLAVLFCLLLLALKVKVEQRLTRDIDQWTTLDAQKSALAVYQMLAVTSLIMVIAGLVGGIVAVLGMDNVFPFVRQETVADSPLGVVGALITLLFGTPPYAAIMWAVVRRRVRRFTHQAVDDLSTTEGIEHERE
ncbi:MAG: sensor histidine kinase [Chloroflexi bacterium]|nr:sensor histidine kinase [Chloroflexota bacterium]